MRLLLCLMAALSVATGAKAADLTVQIRTPAGKPVRDAVVTVHPAAGVPSGPIRFPWAARVVQQNMKFDPLVLIVGVGTEVSFPNRDGVRHHVYSFSPAKPFELKLYSKDETRTVRFDKAGLVALGCNIHDSMVGFIKVVDTPFAGKTDSQGRLLIQGAPAGKATVHIWHPFMKGKEQVRQVTLTAAGIQENLVLEVRTPAHRHQGY